VSWAVAAGETDLAMRIAAALVTQAVERPAWATASIAEQALSAAGADSHPLRAIVMGEAAWAAARVGDVDGVRALIDKAIEAPCHGARFTASVWSYGAMLWDRDTYSNETAVRHTEEALARAEQAGDVVGATAIRASHAITLIAWGHRMDEARGSAERGLADARALGQPALIAMGLLAVGEALVISGEAERGLAMLRESRELSIKINSTWQSASSLAALAALEALHGDAVRAAFDLRELLESFQGSDEDLAIGIGALIGAAVVFCRIGRADLVARADGQLRLSPAIAYGAYGAYKPWYDRAVNEARATLGDQRHNSLASEAAAVPLATFVDELIANPDEFLAEAGIDQPR
jgi:hypothetical protein